jgi:F-type H+-transporting ATPase subunit b
MLIDWFTVLAQAINFMILVWLMKRFLYHPILHSIDEREKKVAGIISDANQKKTDAQKESDDFKKKNVDFDNQRTALIAKATEDANAERKRLLDEASKAAKAQSLKQTAAWKNEAIELQQAIKLKTQKEVFSIARKTLSDLAGMNLEARIIEVFLRRLHELNGKEKDTLVSELRTGNTPVVVRTTFNLSPEQQQSIESAVKELLGTPGKIQFENAPDLVSGIELITSGQKVSWDISDYLSSLDKAVSALINQKNLAVNEATHE